MIIAEPSYVFDTMGDYEHALFESVLPIIQCIESICAAVMHGTDTSFKDVDPLVFSRFDQLFFNFLAKFRAWKIPDERKIVPRIKNALFKLYEALDICPEDESVDNAVKAQIQDRISKLRKKLSSIIGAEGVAAFVRDLRAGNYIVDQSVSDAAVTDVCVAEFVTHNEWFAHEILLDPNFCLDDDVEACTENLYLKQVYAYPKSFWDSVVSFLSLECPGFAKFLCVFELIRKGIIDMAQPPLSKDLIAQALNVDLVFCNLKSRSETWEKWTELFENLFGWIQKIQSPHRQEQNMAKYEAITILYRNAEWADYPILICNGLQCLLSMVNLMRIDTMNFTIKTIAPTIQAHGIGYVRDKFNDKLKGGVLTTKRTEAWLKKAVEKFCAMGVLTRKEDEDRRHQTILNIAMVNLLFEDHSIKPGTCPETLLILLNRIKSVQQELHFIVAGCVILSRMKHLKMDRACDDVENYFLAKTDAYASDEKISSRVGECLAKHDFDESEIASAMKSFQNAFFCSDPLHSMLRMRIAAYCTKCMHDGKPPVNASVLKIMQGLVSVINKTVEKVVHFFKLNVEVHGTLYRELIAKVEAD